MKSPVLLNEQEFDQFLIENNVYNGTLTIRPTSYPCIVVCSDEFVGKYVLEIVAYSEFQLARYKVYDERKTDGD